PTRKDAAPLAVADDPLAAGDPTDPIADTSELTGLASQVGERSSARGLRIATVESCTGGLVGHLITEIPGSSAYYVGGYVTYSDRQKRDAVGVGGEVLAAHGAVSAQVAMAMAIGGRTRTGADLAVAVTGIAGPDGGTPQKPVGLTYVAVADAVGTEVRRFLWDGDRSDNKRRSAAGALQLLVERLEGATTPLANGR